MLAILARTFRIAARSGEWDAPDYWKDRRYMSDREAAETEILRRRAQFVDVGRL